MINKLQINDITYEWNTKNAKDISIPLSPNSDTVSAWYVAPVKIEAVRNNLFIGSVKEGGSVNFNNITFNPHGNGTHTECVGHISSEFYSINNCLKEFFFEANLISVTPDVKDLDQIINREQIELKLSTMENCKALIIRTLPNDESKKVRQYSNTNPPYLHADVMDLLIEKGINHLLIDLPSVDKEVDEGVLAAHHRFWNYPEDPNTERTITEMVYVDNKIPDGFYMLNIQIASFENDASPSKPVIYPLAKV